MSYIDSQHWILRGINDVGQFHAKRTYTRRVALQHFLLFLRKGNETKMPIASDNMLLNCIYFIQLSNKFKISILKFCYLQSDKENTQIVSFTCPGNLLSYMFPKNIQESCIMLRQLFHLGSESNEEVCFTATDLGKTI